VIEDGALYSLVVRPVFESSSTRQAPPTGLLELIDVVLFRQPLHSSHGFDAVGEIVKILDGGLARELVRE
jgi:hypothetical protein